MKIVNYLLTFLLFLISGSLLSQATISGALNVGHNPPPGTVNTHYLGWLDNDIPLQFRTTNQVRMELAKDEFIFVNNVFFNHAGFLGLSTDPNFFATGARSLLHLDGGNGGGSGQQSGFRSWMKYGMNITANSDQMYVGIKHLAGLDNTEAVISWSDNETPSAGPDNLTFKFTAGTSAVNQGAERSYSGREVARFAPDGNVGIGDFSNNGYGLNVQPTQKLDIDGQVRIREVNIENNPDVLITGTEQNGSGDYVLKRKDFSGEADEFLNGDGDWVFIDPGTGAGDCDWEVDGSGIFTGAPNSTCNTGNVGIGLNSVGNSKAGIYFAPVNEGAPAGLRIRMPMNSSTSLASYGIICDLQSSSSAPQTDIRYGAKILTAGAKINFGVHSIASGTKETVAVYGQVEDNGENLNVGVYGRTTRDNCSLSPINIGVYGEASDPSNCSTSTGIDYAGYFVGLVLNTNDPISVSDEMFKEDIVDLDNALELINALQPKIYNFKNEEYSHMNLSDRPQCGLIAQELEEVLPNLVYNSMFPAKFDSAGVMITEPIAFKGVNYQDLIPILIQATKEQNQQIESQEETIQELESSVDQLLGQMEELMTAMELCCSLKSNVSEFSNSSVDKLSYELYQNVPNPFEINTSISWKMAKEGQAKIIVQDLSGRIVEILYDGMSDEGLHQLEWNTSNLNAGTYFYSLHVNDELLVKRAVKIK